MCFLTSKMNSGQAWYGDFAVALLVFIIGLVVYHTFTLNISGGDRAFFEEISLDAQTVSSNLLLTGEPFNWDRYNVVTIGLTGNDQTIKHEKITEFAALNYTESRKLLGTTFEYFLFFVDKDGIPKNVEGVCGVGSELINSSYSEKTAYYQSVGGSTRLRSFMENVMMSDMYLEGGLNDLSVLVPIIDTYSLVVFEHPQFSAADIAAHQTALEQFVSQGGKAVFLGHTTIPQPTPMLGVEFQQKIAQNPEDRNATVIQEDEFINLGSNEQFFFDEANSITNVNIDASNFTQSVRFVQDSAIAVARWNYGDNGSVFFVSDTNASSMTQSFTILMENMIRNWFDPSCQQARVNDIDFKNFIRTERFVIHQGKVLKMVFYLWQ